MLTDSFFELGDAEVEGAGNDDPAHQHHARGSAHRSGSALRALSKTAAPLRIPLITSAIALMRNVGIAGASVSELLKHAGPCI
ncbi:MAG: hypothetical protein WBB07_07730 [Mycobacterium sp.]